MLGKPKYTPKKTVLENRRTPIDGAKKEEMLAVIIRNPDAYAAVAEQFTVKHCKDALSEALGVVWKLTRQFHTKYGELPGRTQLESELYDLINSDPAALGDEEKTEVDQFLEFAYDDKEHGKNISKSKVHVRVATDTCKAVLEESVIYDIHARASKEGTIPADVVDFLSERRAEVDRIQTITDVSLEIPFPPGWDIRPDAKLITSGNATLDSFMGGGWRSGECLLFMAPYGSCKTSLACSATAQTIRYVAELTAQKKVRKNKKGKPMTPVVVLVFTESDKDEYRDRLLANLGRIPWKKLSTMESLADLNNNKKPAAKPSTAYESVEFAEKIANDPDGFSWQNERARANEAIHLANKHLMLIDCTDNDDNQFKIGAGGMHEVANVILGVFRKNKDCYPVAIWIDHLSGLIDRMGDTIQDESQKRYILTNMPRIATEQLGKKLKCPVGLMHQFAGSAQDKGVTAKMHHAQAEGSKSVGKYANFCVVSGIVDQNGMCYWQCTKHRREPATAERIVKLFGEYNRLIDATKTHGIEPGRAAIMTHEELNSASFFKGAGKSGQVNDVVETDV